MGVLVAVLNKRGRNAISTALIMLDALRHRGTDGFEIVSSDSTWRAKSLDQLERRADDISPSAIGHTWNDPAVHDDTPLIRMTGLKLVFEGSLFSRASQDVTELTGAGFQRIKRFLRKVDGSYVLAAQTGSKMIVGRDPNGVTPLYYGENNEICAVASERKALWKIGVIKAQSFPPSNVAVISQTGFHFRSAAASKQPVKKPTRMHDATKRLQTLLEKSTQKRVSNVDTVGVAFSGGLDSSIIAVLARNCGIKVHPICVGLEGSIDAKGIKEAAEMLSLPVTIRSYSTADLAKTIPKVLWLIEKPDVMQVSIAVPLYWTAETAAKLGCGIMLTGQGADELFGGYKRYLTIYEKGGSEKLAQEIYHDVIMSYEMNFQRDEPVCAYHGVELRLPFVDSQVVSLALSLPIGLNMESANDPLRKRMLRRVAKNLGIPTVIVDKPKKAIQFETGVDKTIRKIARDNGLPPEDYLERIFKEVYPDLEGMAE